MARAWAGEAVRRISSSVRSEMAGERVRKIAATAIGWPAMKSAVGSGTTGHCDSAATAWRRASSLEAR